MCACLLIECAEYHMQFVGSKTTKLPCFLYLTYQHLLTCNLALK